MAVEPTSQSGVATPQSETGDSEIMDRYLAICLGGLQETVKALVEQHMTTSEFRATVEVFHDTNGTSWDLVQHYKIIQQGLHVPREGADSLIDGVHSGQAGCGKLLLTTHAPPEVLKGLRCVQALYALVANAESLDILPPFTATPQDYLGHSREAQHARSGVSTSANSERLADSETALSLLDSFVAESTLWPVAVQIWKRFSLTPAAVTPAEGDTGCAGEGGAGVDVEKLKFRVSVVRDGTHVFRSVHASPRLGGAVLTANPGWCVDLEEYDVEVVAFILGRSVAVGLSLGGDRSKHSCNGRVPKESKNLEIGQRFSSLRPSTAFIMLRLAAPQVGDVIVDSMCGAGTIPFLGSRWFPGVHTIGGEVDADATRHIQHNLSSLRRSRQGTVGSVGPAACAWDAQSLPLRDASVDAFVVDMPFGVSCGTPKAISKLSPTAMAEVARVLRPGSGRAVLLVGRPHLLDIPELRRERRQSKRRPSEVTAQQRAVQLRSSDQDVPAPKHRRSCTDGSAHQSTGGHVNTGEEFDGAGDGESPSQSAAAGKACKDYPRGGGDGRALLLTSGAKSSSRECQTLWRLKGRHAVNIGGYIAWLVVLDRTTEPAPPPRADRRRRWVGLNAYRKAREEAIQHPTSKQDAKMLERYMP